MTAYDYIVVGAGSAGCVLAARLAEDPRARVLVIEAGGSERRPDIAMPLAWFEASKNPAITWGYETEPEAFADGRRIPVPRGKVVGGCSSINGMMYSRGHASDYDGWAEMGLQGWSYAEVLPYFKRSEDHWQGGDDFHGKGGPMTVSPQKGDPAIRKALEETFRAAGFIASPDFNGVLQEGFGVPEFNTRYGRRASTAKRFLRPALKRANLSLMTRAQVLRVTLDGRRATGVEVAHKGRILRLEAAREVILSAGAYGSPQILMLSGIGPAAHLRDVGITPVVDLPGVGANLQEHASCGQFFRAAGDFTFDRELRLDRLARHVIRWALTGGGPAGGLPVGLQGFLRSDPALSRPDLQILVSPLSMANRPWIPKLRPGMAPSFSVASVLLRPKSRGDVRLASADPAAKPLIRYNLLQEEEDRAGLRRFLRLTQDLFRTAPLRDLVAGPALPPAFLETDAEIDAYLRATIRTAMHPTSTCAMGTDGMAVLDSALCVRGIAGLRVVDCAAMPLIPGGNTQAPAIMLAEKAADMIRGLPPLTPQRTTAS